MTIFVRTTSISLSVVEQTANSCFHEQESPILTAGKIVSRALDCCHNTLLKSCNYRDVTSVYSLNSRKVPGRFSYGLRMRLHWYRMCECWYSVVNMSVYVHRLCRHHSSRCALVSVKLCFNYHLLSSATLVISW